MPRAGLTTERVIAEAATVADEVGFDRLTLAEVADRFGVAVPSLYKHVDGLDGLRSGVASIGLRLLADTLASATEGKRGRDALEATAIAYRAFAREHPGLYPATLVPPDASDVDAVAAGERALAAVTTVLAGYGLNGDDAIDGTRILRSALHGFVTLDAGGGFRLPQDVDRTFDRMIDALDAAFRGWRRTVKR